MMTVTSLLRAPTSAAAIAAALALSSTPALAQSAPAPDTSATPAADGTAPAPKPKIKPIIDLSAKPAPATQAAQPAAKPAYGVDETTLMLGGGALALLALGGGAFALSRRRRRREEEAAWEEAAAQPETRDPLFDEPMFQDPPAVAEEQPAIVAPSPSAFSWDSKAQPCDNPTDDGSDRCPGETWVERAHRGPSPANPSASLKNRLSRAAFFDKRERDVAAGIAAPVDPDAGLPDAMVEEQERELS